MKAKRAWKIMEHDDNWSGKGCTNGAGFIGHVAVCGLSSKSNGEPLKSL